MTCTSPPLFATSTTSSFMMRRADTIPARAVRPYSGTIASPARMVPPTSTEQLSPERL
jgi:hypothetical protein